MKLQNEKIEQENTVEEEENFVLAYNIITLNLDHKDIWYLDIGCDNQMCCHK